jgi:hypothetical protein
MIKILLRLIRLSGFSSFIYGSSLAHTRGSTMRSMAGMYPGAMNNARLIP